MEVSILHLTSLASVISGAMFLTHLAKYVLADVPVASRLPVWLYTSVFAGVLTYIASRVTGTLEGQTGILMVDAIVNAALTSGVREWVAHGLTKPLSESGVARESQAPGIGPRAGGFAILLAAALTVTSCASIGTPPVTPPVTPPAVSGPTEAEMQATRAKALEIAKAVESIGQLVSEFRRAVSSAHAAGLVTLETRDAVNRAVIALEPKAVALIDVAKTVTTQQDLRAVTRALLDAVDAVLGPVTGISDPTIARLVSGIRTALQVADLYLQQGGGL